MIAGLHLETSYPCKIRSTATFVVEDTRIFFCGEGLLQRAKKLKLTTTTWKTNTLKAFLIYRVNRFLNFLKHLRLIYKQSLARK